MYMNGLQQDIETDFVPLAKPTASLNTGFPPWLKSIPLAAFATRELWDGPTSEGKNVFPAAKAKSIAHV